jgi:hypothetical protein
MPFKVYLRRYTEFRAYCWCRLFGKSTRLMRRDIQAMCMPSQFVLPMYHLCQPNPVVWPNLGVYRIQSFWAHYKAQYRSMFSKLISRGTCSSPCSDSSKAACTWPPSLPKLCGTKKVVHDKHGMRGDKPQLRFVVMLLLATT